MAWQLSCCEVLHGTDLPGVVRNAMKPRNLAFSHYHYREHKLVEGVSGNNAQEQ